MDGRQTWTDCDEAGDYVVPNVLSPRDLVFRPDNMDETVPHTHNCYQPLRIPFKHSWFFYWKWANIIATASYLRHIIYVLIHLYHK